MKKEVSLKYDSSSVLSAFTIYNKVSITLICWWRNSVILYIFCLTICLFIYQNVEIKFPDMDNIIYLLLMNIKQKVEYSILI